MNKKYELTNETLEWGSHTLHRIRALRDFGDVKAGYLGGWIESERNLSHEGDCWLFDEAKAYDDAELLEDACAYGYAQLSDNACACGNAQLLGRARASDNARLSGEACACSDARLSHNMHATKDVIYISGLWWPITVSDNHIRIDDLVYTVDEWATFSDKKIATMKPGALRFWKGWRNIILTIARKRQKEGE